jgi:hypothetical protein
MSKLEEIILCAYCLTRHHAGNSYECMLAIKAQLAAAEATIMSVVRTICGTDDEGNPTSRINFLQRLRQLVEAEKYPNPDYILTIRCMRHVAVPQFNTSENGKGECGACIGEQLAAAEEEIVRLRGQIK